MNDTDVLNAALEWVKWDENMETRTQIQDLIDIKDYNQLHKHFSNRLVFGTAGLRGRMGPGPNAMNDLIIIQTTQSICKYLIHLYTKEELCRRGFVIGYDHRANGSLNSKRFAQLATAVAIHCGIKVYLFQDIVATPLVPFCIDQYQCLAGVMVTASHNPKQDNGYKVYWSNGCQIISPVDQHIASYQEYAPYINYTANLDNLLASPLLHNPTKDIIPKYFVSMQRKLCQHAKDNKEAKDYSITYTAMHGVGTAYAKSAFEAFHLPPFHLVEEQCQPDPDFPTVAFPNPEEGKGALELAIKKAETVGSTLILANDPDADRLAVAEMGETSWRIFTGNEIGVMLGVWQLQEYIRMHPQCDRSKLYFVASTVSSKMLQTVAVVEGINFVETLTGFKWIGNKAIEIRSQDPENVVLFTYEEAIGFCVGDLVCDKDGVSAAAVCAEMAIQLKKHKGMTLNQYLQSLYKQYGYFCTKNSYKIIDTPETTSALFARLRNGGKYWTDMGNYAIANIRDLTTGYDSKQTNHKAILPTNTSTQMITYEFTNGCVATLRTSGTEPKLKYYVELPGPYESMSDVEIACQQLVDVLVATMLTI